MIICVASACQGSSPGAVSLATSMSRARAPPPSRSRSLPMRRTCCAWRAQATRSSCQLGRVVRMGVSQSSSSAVSDVVSLPHESTGMASPV